MMARWLVLVGALLLAAATIRGDTVLLEDGTTYQGKISAATGDAVTITTSDGIEHKIPRAKVKGLATEGEMSVQVGGEEASNARVEDIGEGRLRVIPAEGEARSAPVEEVKVIGPPVGPKTERQRWTGFVTIGATFKDGNTNSKAVAARARAVRRGDNSRWTLNAGYDFIETEGEVAERAAFGEAKYDHFVTKKLFGYFLNRLDKKWSQDLTLRYTGGAGAGYQFIETPKTNLYAEAGLTYVFEDYETDRTVFPSVSSDDEYVAARFFAHFFKAITGTTSFNQDVTLLSGLRRADDVSVLSESTLSVKLTGALSASAMVILEYDNTPARGRDRVDTTYILGLTYNF